MGETTSIAWCDKTFNPWIGCTKISPACDYCYAEAWDARYEGGLHWGPHADRRITSDANWKKPIAWNREAQEKGIRYRVFCASLADVFDNHKSIKPEWRAALWALIKLTPHLDWLLLTKRPQNIAKMLPADWGNGYSNVWLGVTVENQDEADRRVPLLMEVPAVVRFLSCEPLLGPVDLTIYHDWLGRCEGGLWCPDCPELGVGIDLREHRYCAGEVSEVDPYEGLDWVIAGGESGSHYRHTDPDWFRSLRDQCAAAGVAFFFKQYGGASQSIIKKLGRELNGVVHDAFPAV